MKIWIASAIAAMLAMALFVLPGSSGTAHATPPNYCGIEGYFDVPDAQPGLFDFADACMGHDECYGNGGTEADRRSCDREFLDEMLASCSDMWSSRQWFKARSCASVAYTYYTAVHLGGWLFFPYGGPV